MRAGRRRLLQGLAALAASGIVPGALAQSPRGLGALSKPLTGFAYEDAALASRMLAAMTTAFGAQALDRIASIASSTPASGIAEALRAAKLDDVAAKVVVALYSGIVQTSSGPIVFAYEDALAWQAVPWTKPNAACGGPTDYWASAPVEKG
ncbi:MAG: sugar dehydrogenase complex small subunit [Burkholderiales bacterium]